MPDGKKTIEALRLQRLDAASTSELLRGLLKDCEVMADPRTNSVMVRGTAEEVAVLKKLIERLEGNRTLPAKGGAK